MLDFSLQTATSILWIGIGFFLNSYIDSQKRENVASPERGNFDEIRSNNIKDKICDEVEYLLEIAEPLNDLEDRFCHKIPSKIITKLDYLISELINLENA